MKRLIAQMGLTYLSVLSVVFYFGEIFAYIIGGVSLVLLTVFLVVKKCRTTIYLPVMAFVALLACVVNLCYTAFVYEKTIEEYDDFSGMVTATLIEEPNKLYDNYHYMFKTKSIGNSRKSLKIIVKDKELLAIEPFDVVEMELELFKTGNASYLSKKCFLNGSFGYNGAKYDIVGDERWRFRSHAILVRKTIREALGNALSDDAFSLSSALLIGDKHALSDEIRNDFTKAGVSHLIVVSGMHFSVLASVFFLLAQKFWRKRYIFISLCVVFIVLYMAVTGFSPSVLRSGIMLLVCCLGISVARDPYSPNSLGIAAIAVTIFNPYSVGDVGLILSFSSTYSILKISPLLSLKFCKRIKFVKYKGSSLCVLRMSQMFNKMLKGTVNVLCMNLSAFVVSLPLSIVFFGSTSTISVFSTFVLYLPINTLLLLTFVIALVYYIPVLTLLTPLLAWCIEVISAFSLWFVRLLASLPFAYVNVSNNFVYLWVVMYVLLIAMILFCKDKIAAVRTCVLSLVAIFLVGYVTSGVLNLKTSRINVFSVGDGTAVTYIDKDVSAVLKLDCDTFYDNVAVEKIEATSKTVDFCSVVSDTGSALTSLYTLTKSFAISDVLLYDTSRSVELDNVDNVIMPSENYEVELSDNANVKYCFTENGYIVYLASRGATALILPEFTDARNIPEDYRVADYIIMNNTPLNSSLLTCETLVVSNEASCSLNISKFTEVNCERLLFTSEGDIEIILEV